MIAEIRLSESLFHHRKTKKLNLRLGASGVVALIDLWLSVVTSNPDGVLVGFDSFDIAREANYVGDPLKFTDTLLTIGFIDKDDNGVYSIHNWLKYNPLPKYPNAGKRPSGSFWKKVKAFVLKRDDYQCLYCGVKQKQLDCDHVFPLALGGSNDVANLVASCPTCNRKKGAKTINEWLGDGGEKCQVG